MPHSTRAIPIIIILTLLFTGSAYSGDNGTANDVDETATAPTVEVNFSFGQKTFGDYDYEFVDATRRGTS